MNIKKIQSALKVDKKGFSLIEMISVMFIMAIITTVSIANYSGGDDELKVKLEAHKIATSFRDVQSKAMGAVEYGGNIPSGGWGIHIDVNDDNYRIFANENYNDGENLQYDFGESNELDGGETIKLSREIEILSTNFGDVVDITFVPPDPTVHIYNGVATTTEVEISLIHNGIIKKVLVNYFGLVEVLD